MGDLPLEPPAELTPRDSWAKADESRGEQSLERHPESEIYCLIKEGGKWAFPTTEVSKGEGLDEAVKRTLLGKEGALSGETMDSWVVARKPVGVVKDVSLFSTILTIDVLHSRTHPCRRTTSRACLAQCK